jgi:hypothetical protein
MATVPKDQAATVKTWLDGNPEKHVRQCCKSTPTILFFVEQHQRGMIHPNVATIKPAVE